MSAFSRQPYFGCNYDWKIDFSDNYLPYNADYVEVNFNIYNTGETDNCIPIDSVVIFQEENNKLRFVNQLPAIVCDTIPMIDNGASHYKIRGYAKGMALGEYALSFAVHSGH